MRLLAAAACLAVLGLQPPAANAASTELWPGVTYSRTVQFTSHGPVVLHVFPAATDHVADNEHRMAMARQHAGATHA